MSREVSLEMEACCKKYLSNFEVSNAVIKGYIESESSYNDFINHLKTLGYSFSTRNSKRLTKNHDHLNDHNYISTESSDVTIHRDKQRNSYFYISRRNYMKCVHSHNYYKKESSIQKVNIEHPTGKKRRFRIQKSKKMDCPAIFHVIEKIHFVEEDLNILDAIPSRMVKDIILNKISVGDHPKTIKIFHISLSVSNIHNHKITEKNTRSHPKKKKKTQDLGCDKLTKTTNNKLRRKKKVSKLFPEEDICASVLYNESYSFESLPTDIDKNNPLFNLDEDMSHDTSMNLSSGVSYSSIESEGIFEDNVVKVSGNSDLEIIREILKEALNATYDVTDTSDMQDMINKSLEILNELRRRSSRSIEDMSFLKSS